jgi:hypothetical protein
MLLSVAASEVTLQEKAENQRAAKERRSQEKTRREIGVYDSRPKKALGADGKNLVMKSK